MRQIQNHENFVGASTMSDNNDRYSKSPHPSYEFKIPIELFERSDNYGFHFLVFDASSNKKFSWPENSTLENDDFPKPSTWSDIISPDKSLLEFHFPVIIFSIVTSLILFIQLKAKLSIFH